MMIVREELIGREVAIEFVPTLERLYGRVVAQTSTEISLRRKRDDRLVHVNLAAVAYVIVYEEEE